MARQFFRSFHMGRVVPDIDEVFLKQIQEKEVNLKKLSTRRNMGLVRMPVLLERSAEARIRSVADSSFRKEVKQLTTVIRHMKQPDDENTLKIKKGDIKTELEIRDKVKNRPDYDPGTFRLQEEQTVARIELADLIQGTLEQRRRDWHYYEYDEHASDLYLATRLAPNYACIKTVMNEIRDLDPSFSPKAVLDFGSGMGTTMWAVDETWRDSVQEYMNIDLSKHQQHLCELLLRGGREEGQTPSNVFHRQYLPSSNKVKYDMVVAAFSLLEIPNSNMRTQIIENLWHKTNDLLIIIERGNKGGFNLIHEARHFILDVSGHDVTRKVVLSPDASLRLNRNLPTSHILAPCSHEYACPRAKMPSKNKADVCRFRVVFEPLNIGEAKDGFTGELFSYVVIRKQPHPNYFHDAPRLPRAVEERKHTSGQITHKLCCPNGNLAEIVFTKRRYGTELYDIAKSCRWGDILPIKVRDTYFSRNLSFNNKTLQEEVDGGNKSSV